MTRTAPAVNPSTRRSPLRAVGAVSASVLALPMVPQAAMAAPSFTSPKPGQTLPSALDVAPPYQGGYRCLTQSQPGVVAFAKLLNATYGSHVYGILRSCGGEHGEGRALDWMINANNAEQLALGNALTRWLAAPDAQGRPGAMARRMGINYIIWNRQQWRAYDPGRGWAPYYGVSPHTDHIHFSFTWDGAYNLNSWWTGVARTTYLTGPMSGTASTLGTVTNTGYPLLGRGSKGTDVTLAQKVVGTTADGDFGSATESAVAAWQAKYSVPVTKVVDNATWMRMIELKKVPTRYDKSPLNQYVGTTLKLWSRGTAVSALQKALGGLSVDGSFGPLTEARVQAFQKAKGLTVSGVADAAVWKALMGAPTTTTTTTTTADPLAPYVDITLRLWSRGPAVSALQKAIGGLVVDGSYGPLTEARVKAYQQAKGLPVTGVTDAAVWNALRSQTTATPTAPTAPAAATTTASLTTEFTAYKGVVLRQGSSGTAVKVLQRGLGGLVVDGVFGSRTTAAVKSFQTAQRLTATGVVDRATWDKLEARAHPLLPYWGTVLKKGSTGTAVTALQKALKITADGVFGSQTETAVKAAQATAKLTQTGVVATLTWQAIEKQLVA